MEKLLPGFRFHPTDEELITYYLTKKVVDTTFIARAINVVDLNKHEPWQLPGKASIGEKDWYFFSKRDRKYPTSMRANRATEAGYWKTTGNDKEISSPGVVIGMKKTLVFYKGRAPKGEKTHWVMHEYRLTSKVPAQPNKEEWVVCRVFHKKQSAKKLAELTPTTSTLTLAKREFEPFCKDYQRDPNSDLFEISRIIGGSDDDNVHQSRSDIINPTIATTGMDNSVTPSLIFSNGLINLSLPSSLYSNILRPMQVNMGNRYYQQQLLEESNGCLNPVLPCDPTILSSPIDLESFWRGS